MSNNNKNALCFPLCEEKIEMVETDRIVITDKKYFGTLEKSYPLYYDKFLRTSTVKNRKEGGRWAVLLNVSIYLLTTRVLSKNSSLKICRH